MVWLCAHRGEGSNYCLGHGNPNSVAQPKRVTSLPQQQEEDSVVQVSTSDFSTGARAPLILIIIIIIIIIWAWRDMYNTAGGLRVAGQCTRTSPFGAVCGSQ